MNLIEIGIVGLIPLSWTQWVFLFSVKGWKNLGTEENAKYWLVKHPVGFMCSVRDT